MALDAFDLFLAIAALIFLGFLGNLVFSRLRFNDTLILILVGVLVGPGFGLIPVDGFTAVSAIVGPLALILILFDGGLALKFRDLTSGAGQAAVLALLGFLVTTLSVGILVHYIVNFTTTVDGELVTQNVPWTSAFILGSILGGTSAIVVLPSLAHMRTERRTTGAILGLESALTDVLVVVVSFTLISIVTLGQGDLASSITRTLVITFAMSTIIGIAAGFLWLWLVPHVRDKPFGYMMTIGVMFALYVAVEWLLRGTSQGGGPLAVLAFGIILGNAMGLGKIGARVGETFGEGMKRFQGEISFLVRTFFFVFLGVLVDPALLGDITVWAGGVLIFVVMLLSRYVAVAAATGGPKLAGDDWILFVMGPRGLAAAVLAAVPAAAGIPGTDLFVALAFTTLLLTNMMSTVGPMVIARNQKKRGVKAKQAVSSIEEMDAVLHDKDRCQAKTAAGTPCPFHAHPGAKYCGNHRGYRGN